ncbi:uncharacterized protein LOC144169147 [Haemaphysalis longicornis]
MSSSRAPSPSTETRLEALESSLLVLSQKMETLRPLLHRVLENSQALQPSSASTPASSSSFGAAGGGPASEFLSDFFSDDETGDAQEDGGSGEWTEEDFGASRPVAPYIGRFVRRCWESQGRNLRCRKARSAYPNPLLPFLRVPRLNPEFEGYSRFRAIRLDRERDEAFRRTQSSLIGAVGALVDLLDCCDRSGPHVDRQAVAERTAASLAHLGRAFECVSEERRQAVLTRVAPDHRRLLEGLGPIPPPPGGAGEAPSTELLFGPRLRERAAKRTELVSLLDFLRERSRQGQQQQQQQGEGGAAGGGGEGAAAAAGGGDRLRGPVRRRPRTHFGAPVRRRRT